MFGIPWPWSKRTFNLFYVIHVHPRDLDMRDIPLLYTAYYRFIFTVLISTTRVPHAASSCLSNRFRLLRIVKSF